MVADNDTIARDWTWLCEHLRDPNGVLVLMQKCRGVHGYQDGQRAAYECIVVNPTRSSRFHPDGHDESSSYCPCHGSSVVPVVPGPYTLEAAAAKCGIILYMENDESSGFMHIYATRIIKTYPDSESWSGTLFTGKGVLGDPRESTAEQTFAAAIKAVSECIR